MLSRTIAVAGVFALMSVAGAQAELTITNKPTKHVTCSNATCSATATHANLNVGDLEAMLSASDVSVTSGSIAQDMSVGQAATWSSIHKLTIDSFRNVTFQAPLMSEGGGALALTFGDGANGSLTFSGKGRIAFWDLSSTYTLNGFTYVLVDSIATLANDIQSHPAGLYALANDYDAAADGVYQSAPITAVFSGGFSGNGNTIRNLTIRASQSDVSVGLFAESAGFITDLHFVKSDIKGKSRSRVGGVAGVMDGDMFSVSVSGKVSAGPKSIVGGLVGLVFSGTTAYSSMSGEVSGKGSDATGNSAVGGLIGAGSRASSANIAISSSSATVTGGAGWRAGGLIGLSRDSVFTSFATGTVSAADNGFAGGVAGENFGSVVNTYATGFTVGGVNSTVGGLIGHNHGPVATSYSSGAVASGSGNAVGGLVGNDSESGDLTDTYWDTTTSGQAHGVGNDTSYPGVTGLTTEEFQAGLPSGFDSAVWAEDPNVNGGLPYLLAIPPK